MIKNSEQVQELFDALSDLHEGFWEYAMDELEGVTVDGSDRAYQVFEQLEYSENWSYFWTGDNYILFPFTETETLQRLREAEKTWLAEEPDVSTEGMTMLEKLNRGLA
jgi:hypothetical protein